jgi:hypothetical protein
MSATDTRLESLPSLDRVIQTRGQRKAKILYWHRQLPPSDAEYAGEHMVEANSARVPSTLAHRDELWDRCYKDLMARASDRLEQEVIALGGSYAHVLDESIDSRHDDVTGEQWLHGCFTFLLYRQRNRTKAYDLLANRKEGVPKVAIRP